jgi:hypothetical protein
VPEKWVQWSWGALKNDEILFYPGKLKKINMIRVNQSDPGIQQPGSCAVAPHGASLVGMTALRSVKRGTPAGGGQGR